ncbi:MAG TPA: hypothetical protein VII54_05745 [Gaiellaceae bacterium]
MKRVWILPFAVALLAGCGGGGSSSGTVTLSGSDYFHAATETVSHSPAECAEDARIFTRDALALLAHSGANAYPADLYYSIIRDDFADFEARRCEPKVLGPPLRRGMTAKQRAALIADLPSVMAQVVRDGLGGT